MPKGATPARWSQEIWLAAVIHLMKDIGLERFLPLPLLMMESLANLDRGLVPDLLRPANRREQRNLGALVVCRQRRSNTARARWSVGSSQSVQR
jgi:hypothetical protein